MSEVPSRICSVFLQTSKKTKVAFLTVAAVITAAGSIAAGIASAPENLKLPVVLANGQVISQPWHITVEGESVAVVQTRAEADQVIRKVAKQYENEETIHINVEEETAPKEMHLKNGAPKPDILSVEEAVGKITKEEDLTVITTELITKEEPMEFETVEKLSEQLYIGETQVAEEGAAGVKEVTRKIQKENGRITDKEIQKEKVVQKPQPKIILIGTKQPEVMEGQPAPKMLEEKTVKDEQNAPEEFQIGGGRLISPLSSLRITSPFGPRWGSFHRGVDFGMASGSPVFSADGGTVTFSGYNGSYGNLIIVDHGNGMETYYAHCSRLIAAEGQQVNGGDLVAEVGSTGNSTGPHLHFEVRLDGSNVNPMNYL